MAAVTKRIMSKKAYETGRIIAASQDNNREFISLLACVSAIGVALPPALLCKGESGDLQDGWLQDLQAGERAYFGTQEKMDKVLRLLTPCKRSLLYLNTRI